MSRYGSLLLALIGTFCASSGLLADARYAIIPQTTAARHGLTRAWLTQVQLDRARSRIAHLLLDRGTLFVATDRATLHAIDAETGQTLWAQTVGRRNHPSLAPAANEKLVAMINGSFLYVLNRSTGKLLWSTQVDGAPGAGPALSQLRAYVPLVDGRVIAYRLKPAFDSEETIGFTSKAAAEDEQNAARAEPEQAELPAIEERLVAQIVPANYRLEQDRIPPLVCQSNGRALVQPMVTRQNVGEEYVVWPTDRGYLFVGQINRRREENFPILYRLATKVGIAARPSYLWPNPNIPDDMGVIYIPSRDGFVYALNENDGSVLWRFSTGEPILESVAVMGDHVCVPTQPGGMYCLEAVSGKQKWWAPQVTQFIAASRDRIYVADKLGRMLVLNAKNGARLDAIRIDSLPIRLLNMQTDRIYLASETGLIQCLHEIEATEPIRHRRSVTPATPDDQPKTADEPLQQQPAPPRQPSPAGTEPKAADDPFGAKSSDDPFGAKSGDDPFGGGKKSDDPFGGGSGNPFD